MSRLVTLFALSVFMLAGCSTVPAEPASNLSGTAWKLTGWSEPGVNPQNFTITATFSDGRVAGKAAVNNYFAGYTEGPGAKLAVSQAGSTMMAGPPAAMQAEKAYLRLLGEVRSFSRADDALTLADSAGQMLLVYARVPAVTKP
ncbi:MAG: META domain-containing protein [Gammaproteobacteria bacterium]